jgi:4-amino-4-deoxy-L-arabinose transferase-like glycosyltransferase
MLAPEIKSSKNYRRKQVLLILFIVIITILGIAFLFYKARVDPTVHFLSDDKRANWIVYPLSSMTNIRNYSLTADYQTTFSVTSPSSKTLVHLRAFTMFRLYINRREIPLPLSMSSDWKQIKTIDITKFLLQGINQINVTVNNKFGPPALWLYTEGLPQEIRSDTTWKVSLFNSPYISSVLATDAPIYPDKVKSISPKQAVKDKFPILLLFFFISAGIFILIRFIRIDTIRKYFFVFPAITPKTVMFASLLIWAIMFINNIHKINFYKGFDATGHIEYIVYILNTYSLPKPNQGWVTYHPPFFYILSALLYKLMSLIRLEMLAKYSLKLIPFLSSAGQIWLAYLASKIIFPTNSTRQMLSIISAAIIPMNIYMAHYISNEPLMAFLIGLSFIISITVLQQRATIGKYILLGIIAGLALLTKISALPFIMVIAFTLIYALISERQYTPKKIMVLFGSFCIMILLISSWFYIRNKLLFGIFFIGNWDPKIGFYWWQDPGYHTYKYYLDFGKVFSMPYYSGFFSLSDSLYSTFWGDGFYGGTIAYAYAPRWNYHFMSVIYLLAIPATVAMMIGIFYMIKAAIIELDKRWLLFAGSIFIFFFFIIYLTLRVPLYTTGKAFYGLSLVIPFSLAFAWGMEKIDTWLKSKNLFIIRALFYGWFGTLVLSIFFSFFIVAT